MSVKKSIGWCDMTLNPIKGRCKGGCWYCYYSGKRGMLKRLKLDSQILLDLRVFYKLPNKPKRIFLCSTHDLFGDWISERWRDLIFAHFKYYPQHTFQILTKFPQNIDRKMPHNVWLGVTVTTNFERYKMNKLLQNKAKLYFVSFEPLLDQVKDIGYRLEFSLLNWIIIGALTGYGKMNQPKRNWIREIVDLAFRLNVPIFLKDNLKEIWGENLIQEFPDE